MCPDAAPGPALIPLASRRPAAWASADAARRTRLFAGALLDEADRLLRTGLHPLVIVDGYQAALTHALERLDELTVPVTKDNRDTLSKIASTSLHGRAASSELDMFSKMIVDALEMVTHQQGDSIRCEAEDVLFDKSEEGALSDSRLIRGVVWKKRIPLARMAGARTGAGIDAVDVERDGAGHWISMS